MNLKYLLCKFSVVATLMFTLVLSIHNVKAQVVSKDWSQVKTLYDRGSYDSAYTKAQKLYSSALSANNSRSTLLGAYWLSQIGAEYKAYAADSALLRYESIIDRLSPDDRAIAHAFIAKFYSEYLKRNSWNISRNAPSDENDLHYRLWYKTKFSSAIDYHIAKSLENESLLQKVRIEDVEEIFINRWGKGENMTPTLFDAIVNVAIEAETDNLKKLELQQRLLDFHATDGDCIRIYLDLQHFQLLSEVPNGRKPVVTDLMAAIHRYGDHPCPQITKLYYAAAKCCQLDSQLVEAKHLCDMAISLYPESEGARDCASLSARIQQPTCEVLMSRQELSERMMLAEVTYKNTDKLYFRVVKSNIPMLWSEPAYEKLIKAPALLEWCDTVPKRNDFKPSKIIVYRPAMKGGEYILLVSPSKDFKEHGITYGAFTCSDVQFVSALSGQNAIKGYLVSSKTGKPIAGQKVTLEEYNDRKERYDKILKTRITDKDGYYEFNNVKNDFWHQMAVSTEYDGYKVRFGVYGSDETSKRDTSVKYHLRCDRPVYKPGEEVSVALLLYRSDNYTTAKVVDGIMVDLHLKDVNGKTVDSLKGITDEFGQLSGVLRLPDDALPGDYGLVGRYTLDGHSMTTFGSIKVEAYKQPKFMLTLEGNSEEKIFGQPVTVIGHAVSYTQVPISGAKVVYTVSRQKLQHKWRWWNFDSESHVVANGESATTDADGNFVITFTPLPDSTVELTDKSCFEYTVNVDVTDINGETHSQDYSFRVGYVNSLLDVVSKGGGSQVDSIEVNYCNLENKPLDGIVKLKIEKLQTPSRPHLKHPLIGFKIKHTMPRDEFERQFPLICYDSTDGDASCWPTEQVIKDTTILLKSTSGAGVVVLPNLPSGTYRIIATTLSREGKELKSTKVVDNLRTDAKYVLSQDLVWYSFESRNYEVGETAKLKVGSRYNDVSLYYIISSGNKTVERKVLKLSDRITTISIPIKEEYTGGCRIDLLAVKENVDWSLNINVNVPYTDKQLDVQFETFRNKIEPGSNESWTITIKDKKGNLVPDANVVMTMYDASLNSYGTLGAPLFVWHKDFGYQKLSWWNSRVYMQDHWVSPKTYSYEGEMPSVWRLKTGVYGASLPMRNRMVVMQKSSSAVVFDVAAPESAAMITANDIVSDKVPVLGGIGYDAGVEDVENEESATPDADDTSRNKPSDSESIRQNLNTLAFFKPNLRSSADGRYRIDFKAPESLTEWTVNSIFYTKDLKFGSDVRTLVTRKELMVQPNMPRFLRHGDTISLMTKVSNLTDENLSVLVDFLLTDAATGDTVVCVNNRSVAIDSRRSQSVEFLVAVPDDIYVANYRFVARGNRHTDGEQGSLAVLTNRELVTTSLSVYANGEGEKCYDLTQMISGATSSATHNPHLFKVEFSSNPIWYALQSLPYIQDLANPSNISLFNQLYTNTMASSIVDNVPDLEQFFDQWVTDTVNPLLSQLERNDDVKQVVLESTPWLCDGENETSRMRRLKNYFDRPTLDKQLTRCAKQLNERQNSDGGWSWMPGCGRSNLYTTQYILKGFGEMAQNGVDLKREYDRSISKALDYVDQENYTCYKRILKYRQFEAVNIDYLYVRSFFTTHKLSAKHKEAYNYFYNNALKHYTEYTNLYTQAQLALIFARGGNSKEASDIIRRIKQKALRSDEMGMYWRDNISSFYWYSRPIETQAMLIAALAEVEPADLESVALMQQWLLKQKQTTSWNTDVASVRAINALMIGEGHPLSAKPCDLYLAQSHIDAPRQAATGYFAQSWKGDDLRQTLNALFENPSLRVVKHDKGIAWGAAYYQYFENFEKIPSSGTGMTAHKSIFRVNADNSLTTLSNTSKLNVGDRVRVRVIVTTGRNLEFVALTDPRPACFEPVSTASGYQWASPVAYYKAVNQTSTTFFVERMDQGQYIFEYDLFVTNGGTFHSAPCSLQCFYAPEFRANTLPLTIRVND